MNDQKRINHLETKQRNIELLVLTMIFILCEAILWYFVGNLLADLIVSALLLILYFVLAADVADYNKALVNVKRKVSEFMDSGNEGLED